MNRMTVGIGVVYLALMLFPGCAMFKAWKAIPPPGGCDQCHTVPISENWAITMRPVTLSDETGRLSFQTEAGTMAGSEKKGVSMLDLQKTEELKCFMCHKAPNEAHKERMGRFHH